MDKGVFRNMNENEIKEKIKKNILRDVPGQMILRRAIEDCHGDSSTAGKLMGEVRKSLEMNE